MSCILRICGKALDTESMLSESTLEPNNVWKEGALRPIGGKTNLTSGVSFITSEADFDDFDAQVAESVAFLRLKLAEIKRLATYEAVEKAVLDFGVSLYEDTVMKSCTLPNELVRMAGQACLNVQVTYYKCNDDPENES